MGQKRFDLLDLMRADNYRLPAIIKLDEKAIVKFLPIDNIEAQCRLI